MLDRITITNLEHRKTNCSINVCSTPGAMLAPRQFGRPSETLESETPTGEKSVTTLEPTCFGKSSDSSSTKSSLSPRKIGAASKTLWQDFFSAMRPPPKPFGSTR